MWTTLSDKILSILQSNTNIQEVHDWEVEKFNGSPAAVIVCSENEGDYQTNEENVRIYAFTIRLFISRTDRDKRTAERNLRQLVGEVLDAIDSDYTFTGLVVPTGYTMINVFAVPSAWGYAQMEDEYRVAEIRVRVRVSVDLGAIG